MGKKKKKNTSDLISFDNFTNELKQKLPTVDRPKINPEISKQDIGDKIYKKVQMYDEIRAGKLTGMILELDREKLDDIMADQKLLDMCIVAAIAQLDTHTIM